MKEAFALGSILQVWMAQLTDLPTETGGALVALSGAEAQLSHLPEKLRTRIRRFQHRHDRLARLGGLALLVHGLCDLLGIEPALAYAALDYDTYGRPVLTSEALPSPWQLSFSYAFPWVACALRAGQATEGIGIDIELAGASSPLYAGQVDRFSHAFNPSEQEAITNAADSGSARVQRWTAKEAVLKAMGTGLRYNPQHINTCVQPVCASTHVCVQALQNSTPPQCTQEPVYALQCDHQRVFGQSIYFSHAWLSIASRTAWQGAQISFLRLGQKGHTLLVL